MLLVRLTIALLINAAALWVADVLFDSMHISGFWSYFLAALVLGIANWIIKPILTILTFPLIIITLGLFLLVINIAMVALAEWIAPNFSIDGFWTYVGATIVVWFVNYVLYGLFGLREGSKAPRYAS